MPNDRTLKNFCVERYYKTKMKDLLDNNKNISYITHGILLPIVGAIGFGGNLIGIGYVIFLECRQKHYTFYYLLLVLFLFDLTFIASATITFSFRELFPQLYEAPIPSEILYLDYFAFPMCYLSLFGSIYFTVAICFERYMAICLPFSYRTKKRNSLLSMFMVFCFIIIVNIPHFYEVKIVEDKKYQMKDIFSFRRPGRKLRLTLDLGDYLDRGFFYDL